MLHRKLSLSLPTINAVPSFTISGASTAAGRVMADDGGVPEFKGNDEYVVVMNEASTDCRLCVGVCVCVCVCVCYYTDDCMHSAFICYLLYFGKCLSQKLFANHLQRRKLNR